MPEKETPEDGMRGEYQRRMLAIRDAFEAGATGAATIAARAQAMDELIVGPVGAGGGADAGAAARGLRWWRWAGMGGASCFPTRMWT